MGALLFTVVEYPAFHRGIMAQKQVEMRVVEVKELSANLASNTSAPSKKLTAEKTKDLATKIAFLCSITFILK